MAHDLRVPILSELKKGMSGFAIAMMRMMMWVWIQIMIEKKAVICIFNHIMRAPRGIVK